MSESQIETIYIYIILTHVEGFRQHRCQTVETARRFDVTNFNNEMIPRVYYGANEL